MVKVCVADVTPLLIEEKIYWKYYNALPQWRQEKADKIAGKKGKALSVGAWTLWKHVNTDIEANINVNIKLDTEADRDIKMDRVSDTEPEVNAEEDKDTEANALRTSCINLSHSGHYVLCAYSDHSDAFVGCDLEMIGNQRLQVAKRFYCESEYQKILHAGSEEEQIRMFYRYWTLKESFMKVTREGLALDMSSYEIAWRENGDPYLAHQPEKYPGQYYYKEYFEKGIDACMSVCSTDAQIDGKLYVMKL